MSGRQIEDSSALRGLFDGPVVAFETSANVGPASLAGEEAAYVHKSAPNRIAEFSTGRACARRALAELSISGYPLRVGPNREPLWPEGLTGSITHTKGFCGVVVARRSHFVSLGVDAETRLGVRPELWSQVATAQELRELAQLSEDRASDLSTLLFSAKEAFFKCQFPLTGEWIDFRDVYIVPVSTKFEIWPFRRLKLETFFRPPWHGTYTFYAPLGMQDKNGLVLTGCSL